MASLQWISNHPSPLPQNPRHFLQRPAHPQQLVFAEDDQAFIVRVIGEPHELDDLRIDRDFLAACVGQNSGDTEFRGHQNSGDTILNRASSQSSPSLPIPQPQFPPGVEHPQYLDAIAGQIGNHRSSTIVECVHARRDVFAEAAAVGEVGQLCHMLFYRAGPGKRGVGVGAFGDPVVEFVQIALRRAAPDDFKRHVSWRLYVGRVALQTLPPD